MSKFTRNEMKGHILDFEEGFFSAYSDKEVYETFVSYCQSAGVPDKIEDWSGEDYRYDLDLYLEVVSIYLDNISDEQLSVEHRDYCELKYEE